MTLTTPILPTAPDDAGSDAQRAARVVAVLVAHDGERWLPRALRALADQTRRPDVVVAVDTASTDASLSLLRAALGPDQVHSAPRGTGFGAAVALGLSQLPDPAVDDAVALEDWVWLLHDDCAPQPRALEHLLDVGTASAQVGVVGPKLVAWDDATRLLEVGHTISRGGRRADGLDGAVRDQGQHDHRRDVLAVGSAGLLARRELWNRLGGLDPALPLLRDDVDLCWRGPPAGPRAGGGPPAGGGGAPARPPGGRPPGAPARPGRSGQHPWAAPRGRPARPGPPGRPSARDARRAGPLLAPGAAGPPVPGAAGGDRPGAAAARRQGARPGCRRAAGRGFGAGRALAVARVETARPRNARGAAVQPVCTADTAQRGAASCRRGGRRLAPWPGRRNPDHP